VLFRSIQSALRTFSAQDFRDLQVWFNLAWFDPDFLAQEPLASLVRRGRDFTEQDKTVLFTMARDIIRRIIPEHRKLQDAGQIEVITTPYAHPILPLIYNSDLAAGSDPTAQMPVRFSYPQDAIAQLARSVEVYERHFGRKPVGLWPAEGAVAQDIVKLVADAGYRWMASGEQVLAKSLGRPGFIRDGADTVTQPDDLYRPWYVQFRNGPHVAVMFRDNRLSDLLAFEYSGTPAEDAAQNFMDRLEAIRDKLRAMGAKGPHLVSVILDGENAWENYPNDGKDFLNALYRKLSASSTVRTVTPSGYLKLFPDQRKLDSLWPGCWFSPDFSTWIGEPEETAAWNYLGRTRNALAQYDFYKKKTTSPQRLALALDAMYLAEGSDWFWWFGNDQDSGNDEYFDEAFRALLGEVYAALALPAPDFLKVPIIARKPVSPTRGFEAPFTASIDGVSGAGEWDSAGAVVTQGGAMAKGSDRLHAFYYGFDQANAYFRVDLGQGLGPAGSGSSLQVYLSRPGQKASSAFTLRKGVLGFRAGFAVEVTPRKGLVSARLLAQGPNETWDPREADVKAAVTGQMAEIALPLSSIGDLQTGDQVEMQVVLSSGERDLEVFPGSGPAQVTVPDLGTGRIVLDVRDPSGDDHGPGSYTYPTDAVFDKGVFDIERFVVTANDANIVFLFRMAAPISNPWGSGIGLSLQTFDIYIDRDPGAGTGPRTLLEGRNASLPKGYGWEYAIWVEGWNQKLISADAAGRPVEVAGSPVKAVVNAASREVTIIIPRAALGGLDPSTCAYVGLVLSQDGFPAPGVRRVRDVLPKAEQWRIGGGPSDTNHTRIMDVAWPEGRRPSQEEFLGLYSPSQNTDLLKPDDFAQVPMQTASGTPD
jgi:alpha-amylase/alpha-mannosidase (GH57 family)